MLVSEMFLLASLAGAILADSPLQSERAASWSQAEWVVKDVVETLPRDSADDFFWQQAFPFADADGNGLADFALVGTNESGSTGTHLSTSVFHLYGGWQAGPSWKLAIPQSGALVFSDVGGLPLVAVLDIPTGHQFVTFDLRVNTLGVFDMATGQRVASVPYPPPPPGLPQFGTWVGVFHAGDVNGDGWDDLFYRGAVNSFIVDGLIDGQSSTVIWQSYVSNVFGLLPLWSYHDGWPDLSGDGAPDYVSLTNVTTSGGPAVRVAAHSGMDGALLWSQSLAGTGGVTSGSVCADLNADRVSDLIVAEGFDAWAIDGSSGSVLWTTNVQLADPYLPSGVSVSYFAGPSFVHPRPGSPGTDQANLRLEYFGHVGTLNEHAWLQLDATNGSLLEVVFPPSDLLPWSDDVLEPSHSWSGACFALGDIDRDGLIEIARQVEDPDQDNPNIALTPMQFAILGHKTLFVPDQIAIGTSATMETAIPSAGGKIAVLALSLGFDSGGGASPSSWQTMLAADSLAMTTLQNRPFLAVLRSDGSETWSITVPDDPALVGRTLYSRVLVPDLATGGVFTHSTLGTSEISP